MPKPRKIIKIDNDPSLDDLPNKKEYEPLEPLEEDIPLFDRTESIRDLDLPIDRDGLKD